MERQHATGKHKGDIIFDFSNFEFGGRQVENHCVLQHGRWGIDIDGYTIVGYHTIKCYAFARDDALAICRLTAATIALYICGGKQLWGVMYHDGDPDVECRG